MFNVLLFGLFLSLSSLNCEYHMDRPYLEVVSDTFSKKVLIEEFTGS